MFTITKCKKCGKDYMFHSSDFNYYEMCQECYEVIMNGKRGKV